MDNVFILRLSKKRLRAEQKVVLDVHALQIIIDYRL